MGRRKKKHSLVPIYRLYATIMSDCAARKLLPGKIDIRLKRKRISVIFSEEEVKQASIGFGSAVEEEGEPEDEE